jgi:hypothetical protein
VKPRTVRTREKETMQTQADPSIYAPPVLTYLGTIESLTAGSGNFGADDAGMCTSSGACD